MDLEAMKMKGYPTFPKAPALLEPHLPTVECHKQDTRCGEGSYPFVDGRIHGLQLCRWESHVAVCLQKTAIKLCMNK